MQKVISGWYQSKSGRWYNKMVCRGMVGHVESTCDVCGCNFYERMYKGKTSGHYCSQSCAKRATIGQQDLSHLVQHRFTKGQQPHNYIGKTKHAAGYIVRTGGNKIQLEHRMLVEQFLGRPLTRHEVVHHVNGDVTDNRLENLRIMSQSEHLKLHQQEQQAADPAGYRAKKQKAALVRWGGGE